VISSNRLRRFNKLWQLPLVGALAGALLLGSTAGAATAATPPEGGAVNALTSEEVSQLETFFNENGVSPDVQSTLISKFEAGVPWDSLTEGKTPTSTQTKTSGKNLVTTSVFQDGSIVVETAPNFSKPASDEPVLRGVTNCQYTSGGAYAGYWNNCNAYVNKGVIGMGFDFDYEYTRGVGSSITGYRNYSNFIIGGALANHRLDRISGSQVRYSADFALAFQGFPAGWTVWMQANVNNTSAWTTNN